jgi:hypothetical protein
MENAIRGQHIEDTVHEDKVLRPLLHDHGTPSRLVQVAVWRQSDGTRDNIWANRFD